VFLEDKKIMYTEHKEQNSHIEMTFSGFGLFMIKSVLEEACFNLLLQILKEKGCELHEEDDRAIRELCLALDTNFDLESTNISMEEQTYALFFMGTLKNAYFRVQLVSSKHKDLAGDKKYRFRTRDHIEQITTTIKEIFKKTIAFFEKASRGHPSVKDQVLIDLFSKFESMIEDEEISAL